MSGPSAISPRSSTSNPQLEAEAAHAAAAMSLPAEEAICREPASESREPEVDRAPQPFTQTERFIAAQKAAGPVRDDACHELLKKGTEAGVGWASKKGIEAGAKALAGAVPYVGKPLGAFVETKVGQLAAGVIGDGIGKVAAEKFDKVGGAAVCDREPWYVENDGGTLARPFLVVAEAPKRSSSRWFTARSAVYPLSLLVYFALSDRLAAMHPPHAKLLDWTLLLVVLGLGVMTEAALEKRVRARHSSARDVAA